MISYLPLIFFTLLRVKTSSSQEIQQQLPFYNKQQNEVPMLSRIQIADYQGNGNDDTGAGIDAGRIIGPLMSPFINMFEVMQQRAKARAYMDKITHEREDSPYSSSRSIFEMIERLQKPTATTTSEPPLF